MRKQLKKNANPKQEKNILFSKPVPSTYCVKTVRQKPWDNMPQPNPKVDPEAKSATKQPMLQKPTQKLEADMPSEMMPTQHVREHHHQQGAASQDQVADTPQDTSLDDTAINAEMVKLQITMETEKKERMERIEERRKKDEEKRVNKELEKSERFKKIEERKMQEEEKRSQGQDADRGGIMVEAGGGDDGGGGG